MRVTIRLFARLRDIAGAAELPREVPADATVDAVWAGLVGDYPAMAPYAASMSTAVNAEYSPRTTRLKEGDEVAFLPPVSGGESRCSTS